MNKKIFLFVSMIAVLFLTATNTLGQMTTTAMIRGTVKDRQGAVIPQASVTAKNIATGMAFPTRTTQAGLYDFSSLPPGTYDVQVHAPGFADAIAKAVHINVGDRRDQNFSMVPAGESTTITVTSEAPLIETTRTDVSTIVDEKQIRNLPVTSNLAVNSVVSPSNDYMNLATTAPGVRFDTTGNLGQDAIGPGYSNSRGTVVNVDGSNIMDQIVTARSVTGASLDEVQEFQVLTNNYNAEYGQAGGMIVNVITKSGTNSFHGDGHAYFRGRNLEASNSFYNLGFFQQTPQELAASGCTNVVNGSLTSLDNCRRAPFQKQEWGFTAGGPFIKNRTFWFGSFEKTHQESPFTLTPPTGVVTVTQPWNEYMWSVKLDHKLSEKHQLSARFNQTHQLADNQSTQTPVNATPDDLTRTENHDHVLTGILTSNFTPSVVNQAQMSWHRLHVLFPDVSTRTAIRFPNFTTGANFCCPQFTFEDRYQGTDNVTWTRGTHTIKSGFSIATIPYSSGFQQFHFGQYIATAAGVPQSFTFGVGPSGTFLGNDGGVVNSKDNIYGIYLQDTWKMTPNFTVNYGVRYDYEAGAFRGGSLRIPGKPGCFQGNGIIPACSGDRNNVQPRLGVAWSPGFDSGLLGRLFGGPNRSVISASFAEVTELAFLNVVLDSLNFDGTNLLTITTSNPTVLASFPNAPPQSVLGPFVATQRATGFFGRIRPITNHLRNPEIRHVNLSVRRELSPTTAVELDYIGVFGFGLFGEQDVNFPRIIPDPANPGFFLPLADGTLASPNPRCAAGTASCRLNPQFTAIRTNFNSRTSHYNGGVVTLQRRLASHVQFQTSYTFSKLLTSADDFFGLSEPADPRNIRGEFGRSYNDVRHLFNYAIVLDSANLVQGSRFARVANNWSLALTGTVQSGRPYPISTGTAALATSVFPGLGSETQQRPNVLPNGTLSVLNIANADGSLPSTAPGSDFQFLSGNLGKNVGLGSGYNRFDVSLKRGFQLGSSEQLRLELTADFFNILNHTNFTGYNGNNSLNIMPLGSAPGGGCAGSDLASGGCIDQRTGFIIGRNGQPLNINNLRGGPSSSNFLAPNWGAALAGIGNPVSADIPRQIQLSARIRW